MAYPFGGQSLIVSLPVCVRRGSLVAERVSTSTTSQEPLNNVKGVKSELNDTASSTGTNIPTSVQQDVKPVLKNELAQPVDIKLPVAGDAKPVADVKPFDFAIFNSPTDIDYTPENALKQGLSMVKSLKDNINKLELGSKLRKEVWLREIESLQNQGSPTTMIAVCGATGAGKSSTLNAVLDDNVVPTSGMRACTAVVTEIAYHDKPTIDADVSFLSEKEWRDELAVLLDDLVDEDGNIKRTSNLNSDAGIAWSKASPLLRPEQLVKMTADQIIARDPRIAKILGSMKKISAKDSKTFAKEIAKYIDSKDQKRDKKEKKKDTNQSLSSMLQGNGDKSKKKDDADGPALWPLIRLVNVRCNSRALSTGAILVDLPGVADANAARNSIAKDYMKKCNCIWIMAPITRAVDDKTAKDLLGDAFKTQLMMDGNYDAHVITFIATKCDDISCSEVIGGLGLADNVELEAIEDRIDECVEQSSGWKRKESEAKAMAKDIEEQLKDVRDILKEHQAHMEALENGESFTPVLTGSSGKANKKRKNKRGGKDGSAKRKRNADDDDIDMDDLDDFLVADSDSDSDSDKENDDDDDGSDAAKSDTASDDEDEEEKEEVTVETLKARIEETKALIKSGREHLNEARKTKKEASDALAILKKKQTKAQREKNAFCSLERSKYSRGVLKEDFRTGLKELDDASAEQQNPDAFDPTVNLRDYSAIDLPVFTCSSRDYVRLKGQVKGDGEPTCFSNVDHTGIPELQDWCHSLTVSSRERAARGFLTHLKTFANSVKQYIECAGEVTESDRAALKAKWESGFTEEEVNTDFDPEEDEDEEDEEDEDEDRDDLDFFERGAREYGYSSDGYDDLDVLRALTGGRGGGHGGMIRMPPTPKRVPKVDAYGQPIGIAPRLVKEFGAVADKTVAGLKAEFRNGLQEKCEVGAALASDAALETSDAFAGGMHWATYRATLRRHGAWRRDLNEELITPMTKNIASSWSKVFEADLFATFEAAVNATITKVLKDVENSAAPGLRDRVRAQGEACKREVQYASKQVIATVRETMTSQQKEVSRCLTPSVQGQLRVAYDRAMEERGTGSVARQKAYFHNFIDENRDRIFNGGASAIMDRLNKAADAVGEAVKGPLRDLAEKIEVSIAVLWEGVRDDPVQNRMRANVVVTVNEVIRQVNLWSGARELREREAAMAHA
ncbi:hypothetical protein EWM64_g3143, partial [Hericium alpestre]